MPQEGVHLMTQTRYEPQHSKLVQHYICAVLTHARAYACLQAASSHDVGAYVNRPVLVRGALPAFQQEHHYLLLLFCAAGHAAYVS